MTLEEKTSSDSLAQAIVETLKTRPDVRKSLRQNHIRSGAGMQFGVRGDTPLFISEFFNPPVGNLIAVWRLHPERDEPQLLVGTYPDGHKTLPGGHFAPLTPDEFTDFLYKENMTPEGLKALFLRQIPPLGHDKDSRSFDVDLIFALVKELMQEAHIFLMPKELSAREKTALEHDIRASYPHVTISYDYTIAPENTLIAGAGISGDQWQSLNIGYAVFLHDLPEKHTPLPGDDLAAVEWVSLSALSPLRASEAALVGSDLQNRVFLGDMRYGEGFVVMDAITALERSVPFRTVNGTAISLMQIENLVERIGGHFSLSADAVLGMPKPHFLMGPKAYEYYQRLGCFADCFMAQLHPYTEQKTPLKLEEMYEHERRCIEKLHQEWGVTAVPFCSFSHYADQLLREAASVHIGRAEISP